MIPLKLEIENFLSYRKATELDFHGIHLACIMGANGAGKSTLLDAITWALFGQSRSKSDDNVVNRLAAVKGEEATVRFSFELEGVTYRVIRRKKARKPLILEFQIATAEGKWKPLSESRLRETQAAIESLLKMNFDTFINSSFLLQGKADEFTTRTPNRRKEILAHLLGVNEWDRYKEMATEQRRETEGKLFLVEGRLGDIDQELTERPERETALANSAETLARINDQLQGQENLLEQVRRNEAARSQQEQTVKNFIANIDQLKTDLAELRERKQRRQKQRDTHQKLLDQSETIIANYSAWEEADQVAGQWQIKSDKFNALQQEMRPHELALERERSRLTQRISELETKERQLSAMEQESKELDYALQAGKEQLTELDKKLAEISQKRQEWQVERDKLQEIESSRGLLVQEAGLLKKQAERVSSLQEEQSVVSKNLGEAKKAYETATANLAAVNEGVHRLVIATADLDNLGVDQHRLKDSMDQLKDRLDRLQAETGGECPLCGQPLSEEHRQSVLADLQTDGTRDADQYRQNKAKISEIQAEVSDLQASVKQKNSLEREQKAQQQRQASAEARLSEIERAISSWETGEAERLRALEEKLTDETILNNQKAIVAALNKALEDEKPLEIERQAQQRQIVMKEARLGEIERAMVEWEGERPGTGLAAELTTTKERLAENEIDPEAQAILSDLKNRAAELEYEPEKHQRAVQRRLELVEAQSQFQELQQAKAAVTPLDDSLADLLRQIERQEQSLAQQESQYEEAVAHLETLTAGEIDVVKVENETNRVREEQIAAHRRVATAQQSVTVLDKLAEQRKEIVVEQEKVRQRIRRLKLLEKACGREGVQALLIERALPEIEDSANELLARLTGGQMRVIFETQRKLKTSDRLAETLDIHIEDGAGERPYENFSGGEQFRINFAIRLALSKILTRRAGARLQTLVIDEGFGSQDPDGRRRLIEAINTIQDDFERILVITHIDEMRDAFPIRIEVEKEPTGSVITIT